MADVFTVHMYHINMILGRKIYTSSDHIIVTYILWTYKYFICTQICSSCTTISFKKVFVCHVLLLLFIQQSIGWSYISLKIADFV